MCMFTLPGGNTRMYYDKGAGERARNVEAKDSKKKQKK